MIFRQCFDLESSTYTYLIACKDTREAAIIDPVIEQHERDCRLISDLNLKLKYTLETHIHADHITGLDKIRKPAGISAPGLRSARWRTWRRAGKTRRSSRSRPTTPP